MFDPFSETLECVMLCISIFENSTTDGCLVCDDKNVACWESGGRDCFINSPTEIISNPKTPKIDETEFDRILFLVLSSIVVLVFGFVLANVVLYLCYRRNENDSETSKEQNDSYIECSGKMPKPIFVISNV